MKILPEDRYYNELMPINMIYDRGPDVFHDRIFIIYKDLGTGEKKIHQIDRPFIEVYIVKPEYRMFDYVKNFVHIDQCYRFKCHYATRYAEIGKEMGISSEEARTCQYVFGADFKIENYYMQQFIIEYGNDAKKNISRGYFDIENDIINLNRFPKYGETPINVVTFVDDETHNVFTFVLTSNNMIPLRPDDPKYEWFNELSERFDRNMAWLKDNVQEFIELCHKTFDESYPGLEYNVLLFDDEISLMRAFWEIVRAADNDFVSAWNIPWDMENLMIRPAVLGYDPNLIIPDPEFGDRCNVYFREDDNPVIHKKKHVCVTYTKPSFVDDMVQYAGIRAGRGKMPSYKLNYAAQKELKDEKLDYSESGAMRTFIYEDLIKFIIYNIKDVLLLVGIGRKTKDMDTIYSRMHSSAILPKDSFTTTQVVWGALTTFVYEHSGYVAGPNKNKFTKQSGKKKIDYGGIIAKFADADDDDMGDIDIELWAVDNNEDDDDKEDKYDGAFVMNTLHMLATGYEIMGAPAKYVHRWVGDQDITSEYPSAIVITNISNDTLVGKVFLEEPEEYNIPIYPSFKFRGDDGEKYKLDVSNFMMEAYSERDVLTFGNIFLGLPTPDEIFESLDSMI